MKKRKMVFFICTFLLFTQNTAPLKTLPDLALKGFEKLLEKPFFQAVFDLDEEEAVAVFGHRDEATFL